MSELPALFIGRFQPFHLGHLDGVKQVLAHEKKIIIAIGSSEVFGTEDNPFTASERYQMIEASLQEAKIPDSHYCIIPVRDIHNDAKWVEHVKNTAPPFGNVYTGSPIVKKLFKKDGRHGVVTLKKTLKISGTLIRKKIKKGEKTAVGWKNMVPKATLKYIDLWMTR